jgi:DNA invertase Pin-like site-specific DNA recombinase
MPKPISLKDDIAGLTPAIGYIRVSMAREEMISPELQRASILQWAKASGHRIIDWVEDLDKTGRNFKRKIMGVIERVERGEVRVIAVWKYSRFGRSRTGVPANLARVEKVGGQLISATEPVDARTATGRLQRGMIMEFNAFESDRAGEQWRETHQWRRSQGLPSAGRGRFGYIWHPRKRYEPDGTIVMQEEKYLPDPALVPVVKELYRRYVAGDPYRSLTLWLNSEGHRTVRGALWTTKSLRRYLDSGFAAGYLRFHLDTCTEEAFPHDCNAYELVRHPTLHHPVIITDELWEQYQERREFTKGAAPRARTAAHPFTSLIKCGLCSGAARRNTSREKARYTCMGRSEKGPAACKGTSLPELDIEALVRARLEEVAGELDAEAEKAGLSIPSQRGTDPSQRRLEELNELLAKSERSIVRHMRAYAVADDDDPDGMLERAYLDTLKELRGEKQQLSAERDQLKRRVESGDPGAVRGAAVPVVVGLLEEWDTLEPARLNALLRRVVARVDLLGDKQAKVWMAWEV